MASAPPPTRDSSLITRANALLLRVNERSWPDPRTAETVSRGIATACATRDVELLDWVVRAAEAYGTQDRFSGHALHEALAHPEDSKTDGPATRVPELKSKEWDALTLSCPKVALDASRAKKCSEHAHRFGAVPNWAGSTANTRTAMLAYAEDLAQINPFYSVFVHRADGLRAEVLEMRAKEGKPPLPPAVIKQIPLQEDLWGKTSASHFWYSAIGGEMSYGSNWGCVVAAWMGAKSAASEARHPAADSVQLTEALSVLASGVLYTDALSAPQVAGIVEASVASMPRLTEKVASVAMAKDRTPGPLRVVVLVGANGDGVLPRFLTPLLDGLNQRGDMQLSLGVTSLCVGDDYYPEPGHLLAPSLPHKDLSKLSRAEMQQYLRRDVQADIVIHLDPHMPDVKTTGLTDRPAPVLVSGLGSAHSSGLRAHPGHDVVLRITDERADPSAEGADALNTERLIRLEHGGWAYSPWKLDPSITALKQPPMFSGVEKYKGKIHFGFMGKPEKMTRACVHAWAPLFKRFDGQEGRQMGILRMRLPQNGADEYKNYVIKMFAEELGWPSKDVEKHLSFHEFAPDLPTYLKRFNITDIVLSPVPYADTTTEGDALFMGLPVLSYHRPDEDRGRHAAHIGASLCAEVGHPEWHCTSPEALVKQVENLTRAPEKSDEVPYLTRLRMGLRAHFTKDMEARQAQYVQEYGDALRAAYDEHCPEEYKRKVDVRKRSVGGRV